MLTDPTPPPNLYVHFPKFPHIVTFVIRKKKMFLTRNTKFPCVLAASCLLDENQLPLPERQGLSQSGSSWLPSPFFPLFLPRTPHQRPTESPEPPPASLAVPDLCPSMLSPTRAGLVYSSFLWILWLVQRLVFNSSNAPTSFLFQGLCRNCFSASTGLRMTTPFSPLRP